MNADPPRHAPSGAAALAAAKVRRPGQLRARRRGAVLLMILVIIVVLSALIVQFTEKGLAEIAAEGHYVERNRLRVTAYSALETTLAVLADVVAIDGGLTAPAQGWGDPLAEAGFDPGNDNLKVTVSFTDESGRLPLNNLDESTLDLLFIEMGFSTDDSLKLTQSLLDWIDEDDDTRIDGAESDVYGVAEWPYAASNRQVRHLSELAVIDGFDVLFFDEAGRPNEFYTAFAQTVSPWSDGVLNLNSATDLALRGAAGFGDPQVNALRSYLAGADGVPGNEDDRYFSSPQELAQVMGQLPQGARVGVNVGALRIHVEVSEGQSRFALEAVVKPQPGGGAAGAERAQDNDDPQNQPPAAGGDPRQKQGAGFIRAGSALTRKAVPYPFVFLELTEDVGHNDSIAAPAGEGFAATVATPSRG